MDPLVRGAMHFLLRPDDLLFGYRSSMFFLFSNAIFRGSRAFILAINCKRGTQFDGRFDDHNHSKCYNRLSQLVTCGRKLGARDPRGRSRRLGLGPSITSYRGYVCQRYLQCIISMNRSADRGRKDNRHDRSRLSKRILL
jgi:hypothetical protein